MTAAVKLKLVPSPSDPLGLGAPSSAPEPGTAAWAEAIRSEARTVVAEVDQAYMRVAEILYRVQTLRVNGGTTEGPPLHTAWGFKTFEEWVESELGFQRHKANALIRIHRRFAVDLTEMPEATRAKLLKMGWTKAREVVRVLTLKNADHWATMGEQLSFPDLRRAVVIYADALVQKQIEDAKAAKTPAPPTKIDTSAILASVTETPPAPVHVEGAGFEPEEDLDGTEDVPLPPPVSTIPFSFAFYPEQAETFVEALKIAEAHNPGKPKSYYLETIALEYLSGYHVDGDSNARRTLTFKRLSETLGVELVVRDKASGAVLLGGDGPLAEALRKGEV